MESRSECVHVSTKDSSYQKWRSFFFFSSSHRKRLCSFCLSRVRRLALYIL